MRLRYPAVMEEVYPISIAIRARLASIGGGILLMLTVFMIVMTMINVSASGSSRALNIITSILSVGFLFYLVDSWTETLEWEGMEVRFRSWFRRTKRIQLDQVVRIRLIHEGLNMERGIESLKFMDAHGQEQRFCLGPLWRRHEVEGWIQSMRRVQSDLVVEVR